MFGIVDLSMPFMVTVPHGWKRCMNTCGAGVICYQSHCYTRIAIPTLLLSVTATNWIATTISATDINCYLLPLLQPELLSSFTATLHFCYKGTLAYKLVD